MLHWAQGGGGAGYWEDLRRSADWKVGQTTCPSLGAVHHYYAGNAILLS